MAFKRMMTLGILVTAFVTAPTAVNATYSAPSPKLSVSGEEKAARQAYQQRRQTAQNQLDARAQQTRKALMAMVVAVQASCDGACVQMP